STVAVGGCHCLSSRPCLRPRAVRCRPQDVAPAGPGPAPAVSAAAAPTAPAAAAGQRDHPQAEVDAAVGLGRVGPGTHPAAPGGARARLLAAQLESALPARRGPGPAPSRGRVPQTTHPVHRGPPGGRRAADPEPRDRSRGGVPLPLGPQREAHEHERGRAARGSARQPAGAAQGLQCGHGALPRGTRGAAAAGVPPPQDPVPPGHLGAAAARARRAVAGRRGEPQPGHHHRVGPQQG
ncbi:VPS10 domain-containing receptor SorCS3, partial [Frankliniella fusca]